MAGAAPREGAGHSPDGPDAPRRPPTDLADLAEPGSATLRSICYAGASWRPARGFKIPAVGPKVSLNLNG